MHIDDFRAVTLSGLVTGTGLVGFYVIIVALRGSGTHLGEDTIVLVYASSIILVAATAGMCLWDKRRQRCGRLPGLMLALSVAILGMWIYLRHSGRVLGYTEWIYRTKTGPNAVGAANGSLPFVH